LGGELGYGQRLTLLIALGARAIYEKQELEAIATAKNRSRGLALLMRLFSGRSNQLASKIDD
jgi:hypothetical protein